MVIAGAASQVCEECSEEGTQHVASEPSVPGTAVAKWIGQGEDPLAHGYVGKHAVYEVRGGVRHAPSSAGRAQRPPLAREGQQPIAPTGVTVQAEKPSCEDPAIKVGAQFALDEASDGCALLARLGEETLEVFSYDLVEQGLFRRMALVLDGAGSRRDRGA
jgi:hypothetical protein